MGSPTASSFVTAIKVSSLPAVSFSSSSLVEVGVNCDYLIARRSTSGRVRELISALLVKDSASLIEIFRYGTITDTKKNKDLFAIFEFTEFGLFSAKTITDILRKKKIFAQ